MTEIGDKMHLDGEIDTIIQSLLTNENVLFKSQQRGESDLNNNEKFAIAMELYEKNKVNFLLRFGKHLNDKQLDFFKQFQDKTAHGFEIGLVLKDLAKTLSSSTHNIEIKNRRYEALKQLIKDDSYFSEIEMMKRNPLLYEQLVGQYLSEDEKKERDKYKMDDQVTFVKILMEGIERDNAEIERKKQENDEENLSDDSDCEVQSDRSSSPEANTSRWGEFEENKRTRPKLKKVINITADERQLLKEEFVSTMYKSFINGDDEDFNYDTVDNNASYDNVVEIDHDEEEKYFDSEEPEIVNDSQVESEDELDMFMNSLNQHPAVINLSNDLEKL